MLNGGQVLLPGDDTVPLWTVPLTYGAPALAGASPTIVDDCPAITGSHMAWAGCLSWLHMWG